MSLFGRGDFVDYTLLKKKGLLKVPEPAPLAAPLDKNGLLDFTAQAPSSTPLQNAPSQPSSQFPSFDFLDNPVQNSLTPIHSSVDSSQFNELKLKLDDTMFKLDLLLNKIQTIENRLGFSRSE